jgi:hypothetical protein
MKMLKVINFPNMCSNIPASPAYGVYISQLIRYARGSSNYSNFLKRHLHLRKDTLTSHIDKKIFLTFLFIPYLYTFSLYENASFIIFMHLYHRLCRDRIYFDKILVSEYKLFKRSNKANRKL